VIVTVIVYAFLHLAVQFEIEKLRE